MTRVVTGALAPGVQVNCASAVMVKVMVPDSIAMNAPPGSGSVRCEGPGQAHAGEANLQGAT